MSTDINQEMSTRLDAPLGFAVAADARPFEYSHLHFDRLARVWRAPDHVTLEALPRGEDAGSTQLRCA